MSATFSYTALSSSGRKTSGVVTALSQQAAYIQLIDRGLTPTQIQPKAATLRIRRQPLRQRAVEELLFDLGALVEAGTTVSSALDIFTKRSGKTASIAAFKALHEKIASGQPLAESFSEVLGDAAGPVMGLIAAGEASGALGLSLRRAATLMEQDRVMKEGMVSALTYPAFVLVMSIGAMLVLMLFVVPNLAPILGEAGAKPAGAVAVLFGLSDWLRRFGLLVLLLLVIVFGLGLALARRGHWAQLLWKFVLDGPLALITRGLYFGRVTIVLGTLIASGVPISEALRTSARTSTIPLVRHRLEGVMTMVREGRSLSGSLSLCKGMPVGIIRLAEIGERTGSLGALVERAGTLEQGRALRRLRATTQWIGPALIILLGILIGLMMGGLLSALSSLGDVATG